jgi:flagellar motor protein MotB
MTGEDPFAPAAGRPTWLVTLADLALLLIGFFVLMQANRSLSPAELARGMAAGFGITEPDPIAVEARGIEGFAPGAADVAAAPHDLVAWAKQATRDPRVALTVTGATDGSAADVDLLSHSAAVLAANRAAAVVALLADAGVPVARTIITTAPRPAGRRVVVTLAFAGEQEKKP